MYDYFIMDKNQISGSSFLINKNGNLLTNAHVVESRKEMTVLLRGEEFIAKVIATDPVNDLAVLSTNLKNKNHFKFAKVDVEREESVTAIGFGFGKRFSSDVKATRGIVSSLSGIADNYSQFQTDAAIQVGNSGGPVINTASDIVGVAVSKLNTEAAYKESGTIAENVNFAIKVSTVKQFLDSNKINYELSDHSDEIDLKRRNNIIDDSVLYIFSHEINDISIDVPYSLSASIDGILEFSFRYDDINEITDNIKENEKVIAEYESLKSIRDLMNEGDIVNPRLLPIQIWGDDFKYHNLIGPNEKKKYKIVRILTDVNQRVEKNQPLIILEPANEKYDENIKEAKEVADTHNNNKLQK